jgi:uncharacterized membrane protein
MKTLAWILFVFFAVCVGIYPFTYAVFDMSQGLLASKTPEVREAMGWQVTFYTHIYFGALAMLAGWSQFIKRVRTKYLKLHRVLGKVYLLAVLLSGSAGLYIAFYATGGLSAMLGFAALALGWLFTAWKAYTSIKHKNVDDHQYWMIRSYALCFAAVTLRLWLPLFQFGFGLDFIFAYRIIAWLCWVPNLIVAEMIVRSLKAQRVGVHLHVSS